MTGLWIRARAPFAAYRWLQAGVYRACLPTMPPSAAYGLVLNLAGIETRQESDEPTTQVREGIPRLQIAIGVVTAGEVSSLYQQLHGYPVGNASKNLQDGTRGAKYHIAPVRREILVGLDVLIGVKCQDDVLPGRVRRGLSGDLGEPRYGLPFAGDNNLLFDSIEVLNQPIPAQWYVPLAQGERSRRGSTRLTVGINRKDSSKTTAVLVAPQLELECEPPEASWIWTPSRPN